MQGKIPQKIQILKFIAEQGMASAQDINRYFFSEDKTNVIISTLYQLGVSRMWYGNIQGGIWQINDLKLYKILKTYYPNLSGLKVRRVSMNLVPHYLELNRIRTAFEKSDHFDITLWLSDRHIRAIPVNQRSELCPAKIPDAVFWRIDKDGRQKKYFLECERNLNSTEKRYKEIFESYFWREDAKDHNVIFLCGSQKIRTRLVYIESKMFLRSEHFKFIALENFYKKYEPASVLPEAKVEAMQAV